MKLILESWNRFLLTEAKSLKNVLEATFGPTEIEKTNTGYKWVDPKADLQAPWQEGLKDQKLISMWGALQGDRGSDDRDEDGHYQEEYFVGWTDVELRREIKNFKRMVIESLPKDTSTVAREDENNISTSFQWIIKTVKKLTSIDQVFMQLEPPQALAHTLEKYFQNKRFVEGKYKNIYAITSFEQLAKISKDAFDKARKAGKALGTDAVLEGQEVILGAITVRRQIEGQDPMSGPVVDIVFPGYKKKIKGYKKDPAYVLDTSALREPGAEDWVIIAAHNKEAACKLGQGTEWCTADTHQNWFDTYYFDKSPLFVIKEIATAERYQFQYMYQDGEFRDDKDLTIEDPKLLIELHMLLVNNSKAMSKYKKAIMSKDFQIRVADPNADPKWLSKIFKTFGNPRDIDFLDNLDNQGPRLDQLHKLLNNPGVPVEVLEETAWAIFREGMLNEDLRSEIGEIIVANPKSPLEIIEPFIDYELKNYTQIHPYTYSPRLTDKYIVAAIKNPNLPDEIYLKLLRKKHEAINSALSRSESTPIKFILRILREHYFDQERESNPDGDLWQDAVYNEKLGSTEDGREWMRTVFRDALPTIGAANKLKALKEPPSAKGYKKYLPRGVFKAFMPSATDPNVHPKTLLSVPGEMAEASLDALAENPTTPPEILEELYTKIDDISFGDTRRISGMGTEIVGKIILNTGATPELLEKMARGLMNKVETEPKDWVVSNAEDNLEKITWRSETIPETLLNEIESFIKKRREEHKSAELGDFTRGMNEVQEGKKRIKIKLLGRRN